MPAQNAEDKVAHSRIVANPPGLFVVLKTKDDQRHIYHLGEIIEIQEDYSANIPAGIEGVTWQTLRHTFASRLVARGVDMWI
jgi:hypothetical protein